MKTMTFIGTGSAFNYTYGNNAALLKFNDTNLLIDCGHNIPALLERNFKDGVKEIENIFITHMHGDHVGGLEEIAFRNRYIHQKKCNLYIPSGIYNRLNNYLEATLKFTAEGICDLEDYFNIHKVDESFSINGYEFTIEKTEHIPIAKSYMLIGENFIYTGDTKFVNWTEWDLNEINFIFHDTQLVQYGDDDVHASLPQLITLPEEIRKKIYCMHYGSDIEEYVEQIMDFKMKLALPGASYILGK